MIKFRSLTPQSLRTFALAAAVALGAGAGAFAPVGEADAGGTVDCAKLKKPKAKAVCERVKGSESDIKKAMKAAQKAHNDAGKGDKLKCTSCHEKSSGGALKPDSEKHWARFEPFLK